MTLTQLKLSYENKSLLSGYRANSLTQWRNAEVETALQTLGTVMKDSDAEAIVSVSLVLSLYLFLHVWSVHAHLTLAAHCLSALFSQALSLPGNMATCSSEVQSLQLQPHRARPILGHLSTPLTKLARRCRAMTGQV